MFDHLLVPLDGSPLAEAALPAAMELASKFNSKITLVWVIQPPHLIMTAANGSVYAQLLTEMRHQSEQDAQTYLRSHQGSLRQQGYSVQAVVTEGGKHRRCAAGCGRQPGSGHHRHEHAWPWWSQPLGLRQRR